MLTTSSGGRGLAPAAAQPGSAQRAAMASPGPVPAGIFPLAIEAGPWRGFSPLPPELRPVALPPRTDPATLVRSVTGAVVAVSAAIRHLSAALAREGEKDADIARALAALDAAVADQSITARAVLKRLSDPALP